MFSGYRGAWWIAGGWAVDLRVGHHRRPHSDVDVQLLARELPLLAQHFADRPVTVTDRRTSARHRWDGRTAPEPGRETLSPDGTSVPVELLVGESDGPDWVFHRGRRTRLPLAGLTRRTPGGLPYLTPELVLLFKARDRRPKDEADFRDLAPLLTPAQRAGPHPHPWADRLGPAD
ncbi:MULTISPECIES: hypothetical protein [Kitasatospora]|uniref:nucleotidyltransferase domain-containing protein n=1 Tax=Kitasatospora TaxID=2063 RepID=UPI0002DFE09A|nr:MULTISPECIES: hypothetical protein [Kitasatospora]